MMEINGDLLYELTFGFFIKLMGFASSLFDFLFYEITFPLGEGGDLVISMWQVLGGVGLIVLLVAFIIKKVVPLI